MDKELQNRIRRFSFSLTKEHRILRQTYNVILPPHGIVLNMLCNWIFMCNYIKHVFPHEMVDISKQLDQSVRDAKIILAQFDSVIATKIQKKLEDGDFLLEEPIEGNAFDIKSINEYIEALFYNVNEITKEDWMQNALSFLANSHKIVESKYTGEMGMQIKMMSSQVFRSPILHPFMGSSIDPKYLTEENENEENQSEE